MVRAAELFDLSDPPGHACAGKALVGTSFPALFVTAAALTAAALPPCCTMASSALKGLALALQHPRETRGPYARPFWRRAAEMPAWSADR